MGARGNRKDGGRDVRRDMQHDMQHDGANLFLRLFVVNLLGGSAVGIGLAALLLMLDLGSLRTLILSSDVEAMALIMMLVGLALTFGTAAIAGAIMLLSSNDNGGAGTPQSLILRRAPAATRERVRIRDDGPF
jgi:hypothetical protein